MRSSIMPVPHTVSDALCERLLDTFLLLLLLPVVLLQPALGRLERVILLVVFERGEVLADASDGCGAPMLRGVVAWREVSQGRTRREEREEIRRQFVRHFEDGPRAQSARTV